MNLAEEASTVPDLAGRHERTVVVARRGRACAACFAGLQSLTLRPHEWLLVEWPKGEEQPTKYWLSTLPEAASLAVLVDTVKLRWRIEQD